MKLQLTLNGETYCRAGVEQGVASAFVTLMNLVGLDGPSASLTVSGFLQEATGEPEDQTAVHWGEIGRPVQAGDVLTIQVLESGDYDEPTITAMLAPAEIDEI
jgi:hypothetical protein